MIRACKNCEWWAIDEDDDDNKKGGECRIDPPRAGEENWPTTLEDDWCSRFIEREQVVVGSKENCDRCGKALDTPVEMVQVQDSYVLCGDCGKNR